MRQSMLVLGLGVFGSSCVPTPSPVGNTANEPLEHGLLVGSTEPGSPNEEWLNLKARRLSLPDGETFDFYIRVGEADWLVLERAVPNLPTGDLLLSIQPDLGERVEVAHLRSSEKLVQLSLERWAGQIVRLSLSSQASEPNSLGGWLIEAPRIQSRRSPASDHQQAALRSETNSSGRPNVLVYLADALRKDSLGVYGSKEAWTPNIDRFGSQATVFENATSHAPWTRPAVASIFTGLEPHRHGVNGRLDVLASEAVTIAELLSEADYHTGCVITNGNVGPEFGLDQGFEFVSRARDLGGDLSSKATALRVMGFFQSPVFTEPFFLYIHNLDPHHPYEIVDEEFAQFASEGIPRSIGSEEVLKKVRQGTRELSPDEKQAVIRLYQGEVAYMDREFGSLLQGLKDYDLFENTVVVFLSDHGEEFWDHGGWGHGISLYRELIDIPLLIKSPGQTEGRRIREPARQIDIFQTIVDFAGLDTITTNHGSSLIASAPPESRTSYATLSINGRFGVSITELNWKLIKIKQGKKRQWKELYDLQEDPEERVNLASSRPIVLGYMETLLRSTEAKGGEDLRDDEPAELDETLTRELKALGYLN